MKTSIIEVGLSTEKIPEVQSNLERCLSQTGDRIIGHQVYDDQTLIVVRLLSDTMHYHIKTLSTAFRQEQINSFQFIACYPFKITFRNEQYEEDLQRFPWSAGESWFKAADDGQSVYLCLNADQLDKKKISWLAQQTSIICAEWSPE